MPPRFMCSWILTHCDNCGLLAICQINSLWQHCKWRLPNQPNTTGCSWQQHLSEGVSNRLHLTGRRRVSSVCDALGVTPGWKWTTSTWQINSRTVQVCSDVHVQISVFWFFLSLSLCASLTLWCSSGQPVIIGHCLPFVIIPLTPFAR